MVEKKRTLDSVQLLKLGDKVRQNELGEDMPGGESAPSAGSLADSSSPFWDGFWDGVLIYPPVVSYLSRQLTRIRTPRKSREDDGQ